jgi:hypothetical protein
MTRRRFRRELIERFGSEAAVEAAVVDYHAQHQLTDEQLRSGEWVTITQLKAECDQAGITNDGPNSVMVRSIGGDRALLEPWHESLRTYYGKGIRCFHESALTSGIAAIRARLERDDPHNRQRHR